MTGGPVCLGLASSPLILLAAQAFVSAAASLDE